MRKLPISLLGATAVIAAGVTLLRQGAPRPADHLTGGHEEASPDRKDPAKIQLDRLRELGI